MSFSIKKTLRLSAVLLLAANTMPLAIAHADDTHALTGGTNGVSPGQEDGSETSGFTNNVGISHEGIGFTKGNLSLNTVPNFDFGTGKTLYSGETFQLNSSGENAGSSGATKPRDLIITNANDENASDLSNWKVSVAMSALTAGTTPLTGATLYLGQNTPATNANQTTRDPDVYHGEYDTANQYLSNAQQETGSDSPYGVDPTFTGNQPIVAGGNTDNGVTVFNGTSVRSWALDFRSANTATLLVPYSSQQTGIYTGSLTWTLSTGPQ